MGKTKDGGRAMIRKATFFTVSCIFFSLLTSYGESSPYFETMSLIPPKNSLCFFVIAITALVSLTSSVRKNSYGDASKAVHKIESVSADIHFFPFSILFIKVWDFPVFSERANCDNFFLWRNNRKLLPSNICIS